MIGKLIDRNDWHLSTIYRVVWMPAERYSCNCVQVVGRSHVSVKIFGQ